MLKYWMFLLSFTVGIAIAVQPAICAPQKKVQDIVVAKFEIVTPATMNAPEETRIFVAVIRDYATLKAQESVSCDFKHRQSNYMVALYTSSYNQEKAIADSFDVRVGYLAMDGTFYRTMISLASLHAGSQHNELVLPNEHFVISLYRVTEKEFTVHGFDVLLSNGTASAVPCSVTKKAELSQKKSQP